MNLLVEDGGLNHDFSDLVRVNVGGRSSVLEVTLPGDTDGSWDSDGGTSVGDTVGEGADVSGLVSTSETEIVVVTIDGNVFHVSL